MHPFFRICTLLLSLVTAGKSLTAAPIGPGAGQQTADLKGLQLLFYSYRPKCSEPSMLFVFPGLNRNAEAYRDRAQIVGDRLCALIIAPKFDKERFPTWKYRRGGIVDGRGDVQPSEEWTGHLVMGLKDWIYTQEGKPLPYSMIGHSAGGQFLSRLAAFIPNTGRRMVIANPSTWVFPSVDIRAPYGLGGIFTGQEAEIGNI